MNTTNDAPGKRGPHSITPQSQTLQQLAGIWNSLSGADKSTWQNLTGQTADPRQNAMPSRTNAYATFCALNSTVVATGSQPITQAPAAPDVPLPLGPTLIQAQWTSGALHVTLTTAPHMAPVLVYAARPLLAGQPLFDGTAFKLIGALPSMAGVSDISALYNAKFRAPGPGYQICVRLVPVTATGFRGAPRLLTTVVTAPAQAAAAPGDAQEKAPALKAA